MDDLSTQIANPVCREMLTYEEVYSIQEKEGIKYMLSISDRK